MKILITTFYYSPEVSPRTFRTEGLVNYFLEHGAEVDLYVPDYQVNYKPRKGLTIYKAGWGFKKTMNPEEENKTSGRGIQNMIPSWLKGAIRYFVGTKDILFTVGLLKELKKNSFKYDGIISINLPVSVAIATAYFIKRTPQDCVCIAEYGDPYYYSTYFNRFYVHKLIEAWALKYYDYITIPTSAILDSFLPYKTKDKIKIIPQGFNLEKDYSENYTEQEVIRFVYGGLFYEKERDPSDFLEMLATEYRDLNFEFQIYTDKYMSVNNGVKLLDKFLGPLEGKLIINDFLDRETFLEKMSSSDFLINIETRNAAPSKLIDYKLSSRPVLNIDKKGKFKEFFKEFINQDYTNDLVKDFDISKYDLKHIGKQFYDLLK